MIGVCPPLSAGRARTRRASMKPSSSGIAMSETITSGAAPWRSSSKARATLSAAETVAPRCSSTACISSRASSSSSTMRIARLHRHLIVPVCGIAGGPLGSSRLSTQSSVVAGSDKTVGQAGRHDAGAAPKRHHERDGRRHRRGRRGAPLTRSLQRHPRFAGRRRGALRVVAGGAQRRRRLARRALMRASSPCSVGS